jgi:hypothetical protein
MVTCVNAVTQSSRKLGSWLVAGFLPRRPGFASGQHVEFVVDKAALRPVFSEYFGFPCHSSFHQFLHHHNDPGLAQYAYLWQQCRVDPIGLHSPLYQFKKTTKLKRAHVLP